MKTARLLTVLLAAALLPACKDRSVKAPPPAPSPTASASPRTPAAPEFVEAANKLEDAVMAANPAAVDAIIDSDAIIATASAGVTASPSFHDGFMRGFKAHGLAEILTAVRKAKGTYRLLRAFNRDGATHAIFRLLQGDGALNYHEWNLVRAGDGKIRATDVYIAVNGEYLSETFHRLYVIGAAQEDNGLMSQLMGKDRAFFDHASDFAAMGKDLRDGKNQEVLDIYDRLPDSLKKEKSICVFRLTAAGKLMNVHPGEYEKIIAEYQKEFAGDPSCEITAIDAAYLSKNYAALYTAIDHLESWTGGDAYLEMLKGSAFLEENKPGAPAAAEKIARAAVTAESRLLAPHLLLIKALSLQDKYAGAVTELKAYERLAQSPISQKSLADMNHLATSKEYLAYRQPAPSQP